MVWNVPYVLVLGQGQPGGDGNRKEAGVSFLPTYPLGADPPIWGPSSAFPIKTCQLGFTSPRPYLRRAIHPLAGVSRQDFSVLCLLAGVAYEGRGNVAKWSWVCALKKQKPWAKWLKFSVPLFPHLQCKHNNTYFSKHSNMCVGLCRFITCVVLCNHHHNQDNLLPQLPQANPVQSYPFPLYCIPKPWQSRICSSPLYCSFNDVL